LSRGIWVSSPIIVADSEQVFVATQGKVRADKWLADALEMSRSRAIALFKDGRVSSGGVELRPSHKLKLGQELRVLIPPPQTTEIEHEDIEVSVLHEDDAVIVVNKPSGLVVHPGKGNPDGTLCNALIRRIDGTPGHPKRPGIVHRLDKGTSGVMVVARTQSALDFLAKQFAAHTVDRRYLALVWGFVKPAEGTLDGPLGRHPTHRIRFAVTEGGKRAVTHFSVLDRARFKVPSGMGYVTLVECRLETGRTHQIRVHLASMGHPLVGDPVYQRPLYKPRAHISGKLKDAMEVVNHPLLHARLLGFEHPDGGRIQERSEMPEDFADVLRAVGMALPTTK
jgi:23S rRNA pseudouridine1911/1915/1917 synthase